MSRRFDKLVDPLRELFQLDQPDLDFGFYRIMHARSAEVTQFLEKDLLPQAKAAFAEYKPADKAAIEKELALAVEQAQGLGVDPETTQKVQDLRRRLAEEVGEDPEGVEQDNLMLDTWFAEQGYCSKDSDVGLIYVNSTNNLENLKALEDTWKARRIEDDFHRLMFEASESRRRGVW